MLCSLVWDWMMKKRFEIKRHNNDENVQKAVLSGTLSVEKKLNFISFFLSKNFSVKVRLVKNKNLSFLEFVVFHSLFVRF